MAASAHAIIDQTILDTLHPPGRGYWATLGLLAAGILIGAACWGY